ncbi:MAG: hypothetical protein R6U31_02325 [bacterium]
MESKYSFKGKFSFKIDSKGRIIIPSKMRKQLDTKKFTLIPSYKNHLILFPDRSFEDFENRIRQSLSEEEKKIVIGYIYSNAEDIHSDSQGRIILPSQLLEHASINDEILIVGAMDRIELWNPSQFNSYMKDVVKEHAQTLKSIGL